MAAVWGEAATKTVQHEADATGQDARSAARDELRRATRVPSTPSTAAATDTAIGSRAARTPALYAVPSLGIADVDGRIERLLARLDADDPFSADDEDGDVAVAEAPAVDLQRRVEDCVTLHRQQAQEVRDELAAQRTDLRRWLHDGLAALQSRVDEALSRERVSNDPRIATTMRGLVACREDLDGVVAAVRSVSVGQREQFEALSNAAVASNLRLREDLEGDVRGLRIEFERRAERIERGIVRRHERQRRFVMGVAAGLAAVQLAGFAAMVVFG